MWISKAAVVRVRWPRMRESVDVEGLEQRTVRTSSRFVIDASGVVAAAGSGEAWRVWEGFEMVRRGSSSRGLDVVRRGVRRSSMVGELMANV